MRKTFSDSVSSCSLSCVLLEYLLTISGRGDLPATDLRNVSLVIISISSTECALKASLVTSSKELGSEP